MNFARLSSKGQLVIPKGVRMWPPGTEFAVIKTETGLQLTPVATILPVTVDAGFGVLAGALTKPISRSVASAEDDAVMRAVREDDDASKR
ncbi:MAG: AbrB/MazE/SpoVT family DNA-binding domain-containing protein [Rhizobacter sp.]|nr:AbrB/MazE/SpoVT family DNA-binding domain-containing protein [Burkholderiales bacterium]